MKNFILVAFVLCLFTSQSSLFAEDNPNNIDNVRLQCRDNGLEIMGNLTCGNFIKRVEENFVSSVSNQVAGFYNGIDLNYGTGASKLSAVPVCNIAQGEENQNWMTSNNKCGKICGFKIDTGWFSGKMIVDDKNGHCDWEYGQYRGAFVQVMNHCADRVLSKFKSNRSVQLVNVDGVKPNGPLAIDVTSIQNQVNAELKKIIERHGSEAKAAAITCPYFKDGAPITASKDVLKQFQGDNVSQGACAMNMVNLDLLTMWTSLLHSETVWCAMKEFDDNFSTPEQWVSDVKDTVGKRCESAAKCDVDIATIKRVFNITNDAEAAMKRMMGCSDGARTALFVDCYKREVPPYVKSRMNKFRASFKMVLPPPVPKGMGNSTTLKKPQSDKFPKTSSLPISFFFSFGLIGFFKRPNRSKKKVSLALLLTALVAVFASGCDCDDNDVTCSPCSTPPPQQKKGCVYKGCLEMFYVCVNKDSNKVLDTSGKNIDNDETHWYRNDHEQTSNGDYTCFTAKGSKDFAALKKMQDPCVKAKLRYLAYLDYKNDFSRIATNARPSLWEEIFMSSAWARPQQGGGEDGGGGGGGGAPGAGGGACSSVASASLDELGLKKVSLNEARANCRQLSGLPSDLDDQDNYGDNAGDAFKGGDWDATSMQQLQAAIGSVGGDQSCTTTLEGNQTVNTGGALAGSDASQNLQDLRALSGDAPIAEVKPEAPKDDTAESAAEAGGIRDKSGGKPTAFNAPKGGAPSAGTQFKTSGSGSGGGGGSAPGAALGLAGGSSGNPDAKLADDKDSKSKEEDTKFEGGGAGSGGKVAKSENHFGNLFGGEEGPGGPGGVQSARFGDNGPDINGADFEVYLQKMSKLSLFEVVNKRMDKWGNEITR